MVALGQSPNQLFPWLRKSMYMTAAIGSAKSLLRTIYSGAILEMTAARQKNKQKICILLEVAFFMFWGCKSISWLLSHISAKTSNFALKWCDVAYFLEPLLNFSWLNKLPWHQCKPRIRSLWEYNVVLIFIKYKPTGVVGCRLVYILINRRWGYNVVLTSIKYKPAGVVGGGRRMWEYIKTEDTIWYLPRSKTTSNGGGMGVGVCQNIQTLGIQCSTYLDQVQTRWGGGVKVTV